MTTSGAGGDELPTTGMETASDEGTPGDRGPVDPDDLFALAATDDAPLPPSSTPDVGEGGPQNDGLEPDFREP